MLTWSLGVAGERRSTALPNVHVLETPLAMPGLDRSRTIRIYLPPGYEQSSERYPVLYMHDGQNLFDDATSFVGEWGVDEALDALSRTHGFQAIVVGIDHGNDARMSELTPWIHAKYAPAPEGAMYAAFVVDVVKRHVDAHYRTLGDRAHTAVAGSSLGGLISHYLILRYPTVFSKAAIFSPSYWYAPQARDYANSVELPAGTRILLYNGGREDGGEMVEHASSMADLFRARLAGRGAVALHLAAEAEHNEKAWRAEFPRAIAWLFELQPVAAGAHPNPPLVAPAKAGAQ